MSASVYIASAEGRSGKSTVALGVLDVIGRTSPRVGVFRPVTRTRDSRDYVLDMLLEHTTAGLDYETCIGTTYEQLHADPDAALALIVERFKAVEAQCEFVVVLGSDYTDVSTPAELADNARIAANLGAPVLLVLGGRAPQGENVRLGGSTARTPAELAQVATVAFSELGQERAELFAIAVNRADPDALEATSEAVREAAARAVPPVGGTDAALPVWALPEDPVLVAPSVADVRDCLGAEFVGGDPALLEREVMGVVMAGMSMDNVLPRLHDGSLVIVAADRTEVLLSCLLAHASATFPSLAGIVLNGPFDLPEAVDRLVAGLGSPLPVLTTPGGTFDTAARVMRTQSRQAAASPTRYDAALNLFRRHIDAGVLAKSLGLARSQVVTPLMFEYGLAQRAGNDRKRIVLPEGDDDRVLRAAARVLGRGIADLTILGDEAKVRARAAELGCDLDAATVISPFDPGYVDRFAQVYTRLRAHKGMTYDRAADTVTDVSYFGTLLVHEGLADGMVSGAAHTTAHTIRPAFEIIKTRPDAQVVSSVFLMALADRVLVYGDCAVIPDPDAGQLADIAISSATTAAGFDIEPRVAMLSYSTGDSGSGADVDKVREATRLVHQRRPDLAVEGPIQYDAATDAAVAGKKLPGSQVAGRATVFVFPDLNTGNNTYKAVQRSAGALAIGPVLQGLNKPINDLSRGALVDDIVNTIAITAIQAQGGRS
ncbi:phosphate acetyltransferase [Brevibacterium sp. 91QC2O2]|uniref:phosphate acetyltransferase n=1 Tax=Brevibacterium sp. 91QC2O2 TaxID=2968458 RepID=UPI00211C1BCB|nr:phosphate acetyltransferase [Brevibacterium sp. 91QC2O2]MCQ9366641.1 phosphate acetyltransferase [Brevibacterium sp. 91QC2O2]